MNIRNGHAFGERVWSITLFGLLAVMIQTHWELLSYWIGKFGEVNVPDGPCRFDPHVFTVNKKAEERVKKNMLQRRRQSRHVNINFTNYKTRVLQNRIVLTIYEILQIWKGKYWNISLSRSWFPVFVRDSHWEWVNWDQLLAKHTWAQFIILIDKCQL